MIQSPSADGGLRTQRALRELQRSAIWPLSEDPQRTPATSSGTRPARKQGVGGCRIRGEVLCPRRRCTARGRFLLESGGRAGPPISSVPHQRLRGPDPDCTSPRPVLGLECLAPFVSGVRWEPAAPRGRNARSRARSFWTPWDTAEGGSRRGQ
ncbi:hypothetical protein NDU88_003702 [Pleurodeles waltl]|uniref:Uncharacterized protein n=1 Tax=Pleurodeles waltl TaxID=8319 RepID=A0AAV7W6D0_PLEWA|nr:hypothetical protein NDU88_003702 [Pleurodeles waltl]